MTVRKWFQFGKSMYRSDVKLFLVFVIFSILEVPLSCGEYNDRDSRKLFGGYRITPSHCKASRAAKYNRGNTICMFNHECVQRGGEVVGTCMDSFLFGACCQLKSDSQSHFPKGPGVVMTSYLDYPDPELETADYDGDQLNEWHNSYKPVVTPGYKPASASTNKPEDLSTEAEIINEGVNQIANTLLSSPPKDTGSPGLVYIKPKPEYTFSTINHGSPDTILVNPNGTIVDTVARPSDFNVQISSMQTKPTVPPTTTSTQKTASISTHRPIFKPKPTTTENDVMVATVTKEDQKTEVSSIDSIIHMLNSTPSMKEDVTSPGYDALETKSSPYPYNPTYSSSSGYYPSTSYVTHSGGHYVTLKPSTFYSTRKPTSTQKPSEKPPYEFVYTTINSKPTEKPIYDYVHTASNSIVDYSSPIPSHSTSQEIEAFNNYPTNPSDFGESVTTFSYVSSSTTPRPTLSTRKPPSTSYVTGSQFTRRPVTPPSSFESSYDASPDTFSSVTPTVIVLNGFQTQKPTEEPQFVEISQEPFKKPINQITVNNHIASTNNIYMNKPYDRPSSSPTVVITPKPAAITTPYPDKASSKPLSSIRPSSPTTRPPSSSTRPPSPSTKPPSPSTRPPSSTRPPVTSRPVTTSTRPVTARPVTTRPIVSTIPTFDFTDYSPTSFKPEFQTSPDDSINFPPVRNPMLNASGSNPGLYNTSISLSDNELSDIDLIHELDFTTPTWQEDDQLNEKMSVFVSKIVGSLQGTFQELHDIVILDKKQNATAVRTTTVKPKKPVTTTRKPVTTRIPVKLTPTTRRTTVKTTKKPTRLTTVARRTTTAPPTITTTKKQTTTTKRTKPTTKRVTTTQAATSTTELQDEVTTENDVDQSIDYNDKNLCGVKPLSKTARIVGGKNAKFGEWPWQVLVRESTWLGLFTKNKCGGVLITNRFVTTAAHCQPGFLASLVAVFGENDISGEKEPMNPVSRNVRRVIVHREYDAATFENDLALLELESPIKFDAHIVPICMPPDEADYTGRMASVTGWGRLKYGGGVPAVLQEVQVPVIENSACQEMFQTAGHSKKILNSFICAGYANGQKDSCEGDSGGPLVLQRDDGKWQLVGTVSHGIKCAAPFLPGVYMRTTYYKPWLKSITGIH